MYIPLSLVEAGVCLEFVETGRPAWCAHKLVGECVHAERERNACSVRTPSVAEARSLAVGKMERGRRAGATFRVPLQRPRGLSINLKRAPLRRALG